MGSSAAKSYNELKAYMDKDSDHARKGSEIGAQFCSRAAHNFAHKACKGRAGYTAARAQAVPLYLRGRGRGEGGRMRDIPKSLNVLRAE